MFFGWDSRMLSHPKDLYPCSSSSSSLYSLAATNFLHLVTTTNQFCLSRFWDIGIQKVSMEVPKWITSGHVSVGEIIASVLTQIKLHEHSEIWLKTLLSGPWAGIISSHTSIQTRLAAFYGRGAAQPANQGLLIYYAFKHNTEGEITGELFFLAEWRRVSQKVTCTAPLEAGEGESEWCDLGEATLWNSRRSSSSSPGLKILSGFFCFF